MTAPLVVITDSDLPAGDGGLSVLVDAGLRAERASCRSEQDVIEAAAGASALLVQWAPITATVLDQLSDCRFISRLGIGYDMIDVEAATARGVAVANTPDYCVEEVATHTLAMMLALCRRLSTLDQAVRSGSWSVIDDAPACVRPSQTTASILGYGRIGALVASFASALGFRVLVHDPFVDEDLITRAGHEAASLEMALAAGDIVSLHVPLKPDTQQMLGAERIALMKTGSLLVNTCRGPLVDERALAEAIAGGHIAGAALDVFEVEPLPETSPFRGMQNVILTPHAAWYSPSALAELPTRAASQIVEFLAGRQVAAIVNPNYVSSARGHGGAE